MRYSSIVPATALLAASAYAQSATASSGTTVHVVKVSDAEAALVFSPNSIRANVGDMVQWQFYPKNHSVVQSSFGAPCVPITESSPANATDAFFSGFMPVSSAEQGGMLTFTIEIKDTKPKWYYCSQAKHCQAGMVGVINEPLTGPNTIEAFAAKAKLAPENITPSTPPPTGGSDSGSGSGSNSTTTPPGTGTNSSAPSATTSAAFQEVSSNSAPAAAVIRDSALGMVLAGALAFVML